MPRCHDVAHGKSFDDTYMHYMSEYVRIKIGSHHPTSQPPPSTEMVHEASRTTRHSQEETPANTSRHQFFDMNLGPAWQLRLC